MAQRKTVVKSRNELANVLTKLEMGGSQAKVGDIREAVKRLVQLEAAGIVAGRKSIMMMLRKDAHAIAAKTKKKMKKA